MSNPVPQCTHVRTNGDVCGSPAVSGTAFCYHHSAVKKSLGKSQPNDKVAYGDFAPIPFLFPEDRASMQINFFLLLQAFNEQRIDQRTYRLMLSMLKAMAKNLGKTGSLVEASDQRSGDSDQGAGNRQQAIVNSEPCATVSDQKSGTRREATGNSGRVERSETSAVSLSAAWDTLLTPSAIAPENCVSKNPQVQAGEDLFRMNPLEREGYGFHPTAGLLTR